VLVAPPGEAVPRAVVPASVHEGPLEVALKCDTPGAVLRYTLDGTTPTPTRGSVSCGIIRVRPGMTVKAVAFKSGMAPSPVVEGSYPMK
jgi:hypothetical protein